MMKEALCLCVIQCGLKGSITKLMGKVSITKLMGKVKQALSSELETVNAELLQKHKELLLPLPLIN